MREPKKLEHAKARLEIMHLWACHVSPIKVRSCEVPSSRWLPTGRLFATFHVGREGQRGVPKGTHSLTLSGCGPTQGKEADAKEKRMAWDWARCQSPRRQARTSGGMCWGWESRLHVRKAVGSPQAAREATPAPSPCRSTRTVCPMQHVLRDSSQFVNLDSTHSRAPLSFFPCFPVPGPWKISHTWLLLDKGADKCSSLHWQSVFPKNKYPLRFL